MTHTLYRLDGCPDCAAVAARLADLGLDYEAVPVAPLHSAREEIERVSGQRTVPVLVDETYGATVVGAAAILEFLETSYGGE